MTLYFDKSRNLTNSDVSGGELVDEDAYNTYTQAYEEKKRAIQEQNAAVDAAQTTGDAEVANVADEQDDV